MWVSFYAPEIKAGREEGRGYWRCGSFQSKCGTEVEGQTFTPPMALWSKYHDSRQASYRAKHCKLPKERQMLCTDIQIPVGAPEEVFVRAWNLIVSQGFRHTAAESEDMLVLYRANEMIRLLSEVGRLEAFNYEL